MEVAWANTFPYLENTKTQDPRVFKSNWEKEQNGINGFKKRTYFACVVMGTETEANNCYAVDVIKRFATHDKEAETNALAKVIEGCNYYEKHHTWPKDSQEKNEDSSKT